MRKISKLLGMALVLLVLATTAALGESALAVFDPNANGAVRTVVVQPDGKIPVSGNFNTLSPNGETTVTRDHIAPLNPDGTLDMGFDPKASLPVFEIAARTDDKAVAGGA